MSKLAGLLPAELQAANSVLRVALNGTPAGLVWPVPARRRRRLRDASLNRKKGGTFFRWKIRGSGGKRRHAIKGRCSAKLLLTARDPWRQREVPAAATVGGESRNGPDSVRFWHGFETPEWKRFF